MSRFLCMVCHLASFSVYTLSPSIFLLYIWTFVCFVYSSVFISSFFLLFLFFPFIFLVVTFPSPSPQALVAYPPPGLKESGSRPSVAPSAAPSHAQTAQSMPQTPFQYPFYLPMQVSLSNGGAVKSLSSVETSHLHVFFLISRSALHPLKHFCSWNGAIKITRENAYGRYEMLTKHRENYDLKHGQ